MFFDIVLIRCIALTQQFQKIWILIEGLNLPQWNKKEFTDHISIWFVTSRWNTTSYNLLFENVALNFVQFLGIFWTNAEFGLSKWQVSEKNNKESE